MIVSQLKHGRTDQRPLRGKSGSYSQGLVVTRTDSHCQLGNCGGYRVDSANAAALSERFLFKIKSKELH